MKLKEKEYIYIYRYTSHAGILHRTGTDLSQSQLLSATVLFKITDENDSTCNGYYLLSIIIRTIP